MLHQTADDTRSTVRTNLSSVPQKPNKIAILGAFGQQNFGNECTLQAFLSNCRKYLPDAKIQCLCTVPADTSARHQLSAFPLSAGPSKQWPRRKSLLLRLLRKVFIYIPMEVLHWAKAFQTLAGNDVLFVPGTGFLSDAYQNSFGWPYDIFKWSLIARVCRSKLVYVSVGAGPLQRPLSRWFIKSALSLADFRSYRDSSTKEYLAGIGFPTHTDRVYPDLAFHLPEAAISCADTHKRPRPVVGIGLMAYGGEPNRDVRRNVLDRDYLGKLAIFVNWLLSHDYHVRLLIGDARYDEVALQHFRTLLTPEVWASNRGRILDEPASSGEHLLSQLAATDLVVATRFHNVLLALICNKPVISISFHHKCASLMRDMGLSEYCQDIHCLNVARLIEQFCSLEKNAEKLKPLIHERTEACRRALDEQYAVIFNGVHKTYV